MAPRGGGLPDDGGEEDQPEKKKKRNGRVCFGPFQICSCATVEISNTVLSAVWTIWSWLQTYAEIPPASSASSWTKPSSPTGERVRWFRWSNGKKVDGGS